MSNKTEIAKAITSTLCHIHLHFNNLLPDYLSSTMCPNNTNYFVNYHPISISTRISFHIILIFSSILHTLPPSDQLIKTNCLHNIWVWPSTYEGYQILGLTTNLQRIWNDNKIIEINFSLSLTTNLWRTPITKKAISSATAYSFSFSNGIHIYPPFDLLNLNTYDLQSLVLKRLTVNQKSKSITYQIKSAYFF